MTGANLPPRIGRLEELAYNLWWSWHRPARELFRSLDYPLWRLSGHNPVKQLLEIGEDKLAAAAADPDFLRLYDSVISAFDADMSGPGNGDTREHLHALGGPVAYFSMEFAIHNSLPIYAGGLGVLAGDVCKEASDSGVPMVGVGFMYPEGYFHQHISDQGWQEEIYAHVNFEEAPIQRMGAGARPDRQGPPVEIRLDSRSLHIGAWKVRVGRVDLYLLSCDIEENRPEDRQLCARLYTADREERLQQEIVLGIGGVRVLRALGIEPSVWHANEGHSAFMMLERAREKVEQGMSFSEAVRAVRASTVFTTHTVVPAAHDTFPVPLMEKYVQHWWGPLGVEGRTLLELGQERGAGDQPFNMTVLGLKMAARRNAVSRLHGTMTRRMWRVLWSGHEEDQVPISSITNGVHLPTWVAPEMSRLYEKHIEPEMLARYDDGGIGELVRDIPDEELWAVRQTLKRKLIGAMVERARECASERQCPAHQVLGMGALLDPNALTIGFVRRFAAYKRPELILRDPERLKRIVNDPWHPVQIVFAGKSHPADHASKHLLRHVYTRATDPEFQGRIAFVEDYDIHMAHYLTQGVDVWLNTPIRLQEASGTSGMKAAVNGVLHLSVPDGWWYEGYNGSNGWSVGEAIEAYDPGEEDRSDAAALYRLLEEEIVPLYYRRDRSGVPRDWLRMAKEAISSIVPTFCARRMLREYVEQMYLPAAAGGEPADGFASGSRPGHPQGLQ